jgi:hypothetical protein
MVGSTSALTPTDNTPALRVPPKWSFSIGFHYSTFISLDGSSLYYSSSALPPWVEFDQKGITFDGVVPHLPDNTTTDFKFVLYGSDRQGYSAVFQTFHLIIAAHELSQTTPLVPMNLTSGQKFNTTLDAFDLSGIVLDNSTIHSLANFSGTIDTSAYPWFTSSSNMSLAGTAPMGPMTVILPFSLTATDINQTLHTNLTVNIVASVFKSADLPTWIAPPGSYLDLDLSQYFINSKVDPDLNVTIVSPDAPWLKYNGQNFHISGDAPSSSSGQKQKFAVTILARPLESDIVYQAQLPVTLGDQTVTSGTVSNASSGKRTRTILVAIFGSVIPLIAVVVIIVCCTRHQRDLRNQQKGMTVVDEKGMVYWREKGGLDGFATYESNNALDDSEKRTEFQQVFVTPPPSGDGGEEAAAVTPASVIPGGKIRKADFFQRMKDSVGRRARQRPEISRPVVSHAANAPLVNVDVPTHRVTISRQEDFEDRCVLCLCYNNGN